MKKKNNTYCADCAFAVWDDITQTGCEFGLIDKFKERKANVLECYDDNSEFYVIEDRICPFKRSKAWKKHYGDSYKAVLLNSKFLKFVPIVFANGNIDKLKTTLNALSVQSFLPEQIIIVNTYRNIIPSKQITALMDTMDVPWRLDNQLKEFSREEYIAHAYSKLEKVCTHIVVLEAGDYVPQVFLKAINNFTVNELFIYSIIKPNHTFDYVGGLTIPLSVYKHWYPITSEDSGVLKAIEEWNNKESAIQTIYSIDEVLSYVK